MALIIGPDPPRQIDWETLGKPAALDGFFRRALAKDANERFASGAELIDAMSALAADSETCAPQKVDPTLIARFGPACGRVLLAGFLFCGSQVSLAKEETIPHVSEVSCPSCAKTRVFRNRP